MAVSRQGLRTFSSQVALGAICVALLNGCQLTKNQLTYDRAAEAERQEYRDALAPVVLPPKENDAATPDFQPVVSTPSDLKLPSPLVTVSVNRTVSLRDLLFELADQADVDLELDPQIRGSIIFSAKNRPFNQVVDRICEMAGLRYKISKDNVLRIELDRPYSKSYLVDYVAAARQHQSTISTNISMSKAGGDTDAEGGGQSSASLNTRAGGDTWKELTDNLTQILAASDTSTTLATMADPVAVPVNPMPVAANGTNPPPPSLPGSPQVAPMAATAAPTLNISSGAAEPLLPNPPATFSISRQTGLVTVFGSERQHKLIGKFLEDFRKRSTTQVLIEAKVLQVQLNDEFATGINWQTFNVTGMSYWTPSFARPTLSAAETGAFSGVLNFGNLDGVVEMMSRFGTVRALSSPRVTVVNNQPAMVNVSHNNVYFEFDVQVETNDQTNRQTITVDSEQKSIPDGVFLNVIPTANPDTGEVQLVVRPTISTITGSQVDPTIALTLALNGVDPTVEIPTNRVPEVSIQEVDSILKMQSGQMMVMGGLMKDANTVEEQGVPLLGDIPLLGYAFKNHSDRVEKSELVVLLKATIVPGGKNADDTDKKIYEKFGEDRRPSRL